jgi:hypothetical protein
MKNLETYMKLISWIELRSTKVLAIWFMESKIDELKKELGIDIPDEQIYMDYQAGKFPPAVKKEKRSIKSQVIPKGKKSKRKYRV